MYNTVEEYFKGWAPLVRPVSMCPMGLENLAPINQLLVHQEAELVDAEVGFESDNKFEVKNKMGQRLYYALEDSGKCCRCCCGQSRAFTIGIYDRYHREVVGVSRPCRSRHCGCCCSFCRCCKQEVIVMSPNGLVLGYVRQQRSCKNPKYIVINESGRKCFHIAGSRFSYRGRKSINFVISDISGRKIGSISKESHPEISSLEMLEAQFPVALHVKAKACLLGTLFLFGFLYF